jgi:hypothetical protein
MRVLTQSFAATQIDHQVCSATLATDQRRGVATDSVKGWRDNLMTEATDLFAGPAGTQRLRRR